MHDKMSIDGVLENKPTPRSSRARIEKWALNRALIHDKVVCP